MSHMAEVRIYITFKIDWSDSLIEIDIFIISILSRLEAAAFLFLTHPQRRRRRRRVGSLFTTAGSCILHSIAPLLRNTNLNLTITPPLLFTSSSGLAHAHESRADGPFRECTCSEESAVKV